jgi:hypothetical protein
LARASSGVHPSLLLRLCPPPPLLWRLGCPPQLLLRVSPLLLMLLSAEALTGSALQSETSRSLAVAERQPKPPEERYLPLMHLDKFPLLMPITRDTSAPELHTRSEAEFCVHHTTHGAAVVKVSPCGYKTDGNI